MPTSLLPADGQKRVPIQVAEKIIADISSGIYRTPAAALKELVTNAYDADATRVDISTGAPTFSELVIRDNGAGMTIDRFVEVVQHIGGSWKRIENAGGVSSLFKRPVIGRIGIGLLAVAQLGQRFYVSSSVRGSSTRFLAEVDLSQFHKDDAALKTLATGDDKVEIGSIRYVDGLPEKADSHFTIITVPDPKQGLVSELHNQLRDIVNAKHKFDLAHPAPSFDNIVQATLENNRADAVLDGYHYILWELGLLCPVAYLKGPVFDSSRRRILGSFDPHAEDPRKFSLFVDDYEIRRPLRFPNPIAIDYGGLDPKVYVLAFDGEVAGRRLHFGGYIYAQKPRIQPVEVQGLHIRVRGVGIGGYDRTWMGYPFDEGIKFGQVTGELFVHDGLESALNIDRASFRETDPHYLAVRALIWQKLQREVFPEFKSRQKEHRGSVQKGAAEARKKRLNEALSDAPEPVGVSPSVARLKKSLPDPDAVSVINGEVVVSGAALDAIEEATPFKKDTEERLLRVVVVLAAYGVWQQLNDEDTRALLNALAVAVAE